MKRIEIDDKIYGALIRSARISGEKPNEV